MMRRNRSAVDILEDHERAIKRLQQALARAGAGGVSDHGALTGLDPDDDHPQYLKTDGTRAGTGQQSLLGVRLLAEDPTNEGGQVVFEGAGAYTTTMFLDRYQDSFRFIYNVGVTAEITSAGEIIMTGTADDYGLYIRGTDDTKAGMAVLHLVNADGGSAHVNDAWQMHHRGGSGSEGDLIFYYYNSGGPTWDKWLIFDQSLNEIQTTKRGGNIHFGYQASTDSPSYMTFDSGAFWQWRSFTGSAYTTRMQLDTTKLQINHALVVLGAATFGSIVTDGWTGVSFASGWVNYNSGFETAAYKKTKDGTVYIKGLVKNGTSSGTIFTLPAGYRPAGTIMFRGQTSAGAGDLRVLATGKVHCATGGSSTWSSTTVNFQI